MTGIQTRTATRRDSACLPVTARLTNQEKTELTNRPIVPVYLNQKLVFDLLAMLQDGISTVTTVTQSSTDSATDQNQVSAGFGLGAALSTLIKVGVSGDMSSQNSSDESTTSSEERVYTPASLFFRLRNVLNQKGYILSTFEDFPRPGDFIEFEGSLRRNPMIETLDTFYEIGELATSFNDNLRNSPQTGKNSGRQQQLKRSPASEDEKVLWQISRLRDSIAKEDTMDIIARNVNGNLSVVITLETGSLNDPRLSDLVDGQFKVLGKVINAIESDSDSINLLRDTALNRVPQSVLDSFSLLSDQLKSQGGFNLPDLEWKVEGPAIQILPIAIFA